MADFLWTNAAGGDWSDPANWELTTGIGAPPPGIGDSGTFNDLTTSYTVVVQAGSIAGAVSTSLSIDADPVGALTGTPSFDISGTLTADIFYGTASNGPATGMTIEAGGALIVPLLLFSNDHFETVTISGKEAGGFVDLGDITTGGLVSGINSLIIFDFANAGPTALNTGVVQIDNVDLASGIHAAQTIADVGRGDEIVINGVDFTGDTITLDTATNELTVMNGGSVVFTMDNVSLEAGAVNEFAIVNGDTIEAVCYACGTMIRTPAGDLAVETLRPGMQVITVVDGATVPQAVKWVGHRRIDLTRHARPEKVAPVRIERNAFADDVPHTDLLLSPDHAVFADGMLICARQLVNGTTVRQECEWTSVDYYHVELDRHAILLADGLPAESYLDTGNRGFFANSDEPLSLHPELTNDTARPTRQANSCVPFVWDEASVQPVWQRLADRAVRIGRPMSQRMTVADANLELLINRRLIRPIFSDSNGAIFILPAGASEVLLLSRAQSPTDARPWLEDRRRLGVRVRRIVLRGGDAVCEIPMDHAALTHGWWEVERDGPDMSRWTDGEAVLPLPAMRECAVLEIQLAESMIYVVDAAPASGTERRAVA